MTFARLQSRGGAEIHSRHDIIDHLDPTKFIQTVEFMAKFSDQIVNAKVFPVIRQIPKELSEKMNRFKKMMEDAKKAEEAKKAAEGKKEEPKEEKKEETK